MNNARWQQIEELYHAALAVPVEARATWLEDECGTDGELRHELESLLVSHAQAAQGFIAEPAFAAVAVALAETQTSLAPNQHLGNYQILKPLGAGGMGEVYLARDERLGRQVALKILPPLLATDAEWMRRFQQEARTASALNHPNILTVHEIGQANGVTYLATEFVDGETLRTRLQNGPLPLTEVLDIARQIASALQAAHAADIIHRDIKPENLMLRHDGFVKILDFGIAKQVGAPTDAAVANLPHTRTGAILGSAPYVSPEQARGEKDIDARSDLFSLGAVLYELLTGQAPFTKPTVAETVGAILYTEPPSLRALRPDVPVVWQEIVSKALQKERAARHQTVGELAVDLARLIHPPPTDNEAAQKIARTGQRAGIDAHSALPLLRGLLLVFLVSVTAVWAYRLWRPIAPTFQAEMRKLTASGKVSLAALSPDANYFVYAEEEAGKQSLFVRQVSGNEPVRLAMAEEVRYLGLVFAPDGQSVYFVRRGSTENVGTLYRISTLGGSPEKLVSDVDSAVTLAPDGKSLAFGRNHPASNESQLVLAQANGNGERILARRRLADYLCGDGIAWAPDGKTIACAAREQSAAGFSANVIAIGIANGVQKQLNQHTWRAINGLAWLHDGAGLLVAAADKDSLYVRIFQLAFPSGEVSKFSHDLSSHLSVSLATQSHTLATVKRQQFTTLWLLPEDGNLSQAQQLPTGTESFYDLAWQPDGNLLVSIVTNDSPDLWRYGLLDKRRHQLSFGPAFNFRGQPTPDGRYVVYTSNQNGVYNIWRMNADGAQKQALTNGRGEFSPVVTPDSRWVFYHSDASGWRIWKVPIVGDAPQQFIEQESKMPVISPNGDRLACFWLNPARAKQWEAAVFSIAGGLPLATFNLPVGLMRWRPDGQALVYLNTQNGVSNLWQQPLAGGAPQQLTHFQAEKITWFDWSATQQKVAFIRQTELSDVVLLRN